MQYVGHLLPAPYVFEGMRAVIPGQHVAVVQLAWDGGLALLYILLAACTFTRMHRHAVDSGLLARYSAETAN
jgi:ABC-2 type transport system permease protein